MRKYLVNKAWGAVVLAVLGSFLAAGLLMASGCGQDSSATASGPKVFTYSEVSDPASLDPALVNESVGGNIDRYLFEGLVSYDPQTGEAKPAVAKSWDVNGDATVFTFHLNQGLKFSDGQEVTASDFIYAWTRALSPDTASPTAPDILGGIKGAEDLAKGKTKTLAGVEAPDKYTLKVTLDSPMAEFPAMLGHPVASPVPQKEVERQDVKFADQPTGNGPFTIKEWQHNDHVTLEKNPQYSGASSPKLDKVVVKIIPKPDTAVAELKAGNVDAVKSIDPGQSASLKNDGSVRYFQAKSDSVNMIGFDTSKAPFDNTKVRQAISLLVDRKTIADKVLQGQQYPADGLIPTSVNGYMGGVMPDPDPAKAASLLTAAGYPGGKGLPQLTLTYPQVPSAADMAQAIQSDLKAGGIQVTIDGLDMNAFMDALQGGKLNMFLVKWQTDYPGMDGFLQPLFHSDNVGSTDVFNYSNPDVDKLLDQARATTDAGQRNKLYNDAEGKIMADDPAVPVVFGMDTMVYAPRVTNFVYTPLGDIALDQITVSN